MTDLLNIKAICVELISDHAGIPKEKAEKALTVTEPRPWIVNIKYDDGKQGMSIEVFVRDIKPADIKQAVIAPAMKTLLKAIPKRGKKTGQTSKAMIICQKKGNSYQLESLHLPYRAILRDDLGRDILNPNGSPKEALYCCKCQKPIGKIESAILESIRRIYLAIVPRNR